jgi:hypothetical protein
MIEFIIIGLLIFIILIIIGVSVYYLFYDNSNYKQKYLKCESGYKICNGKLTSCDTNYNNCETDVTKCKSDFLDYNKTIKRFLVIIYHFIHNYSTMFNILTPQEQTSSETLKYINSMISILIKAYNSDIDTIEKFNKVKQDIKVDFDNAVVWSTSDPVFNKYKNTPTYIVISSFNNALADLKNDLY